MNTCSKLLGFIYWGVCIRGSMGKTHNLAHDHACASCPAVVSNISAQLHPKTFIAGHIKQEKFQSCLLMLLTGDLTLAGLAPRQAGVLRLVSRLKRGTTPAGIFPSLYLCFTLSFVSLLSFPLSLSGVCWFIRAIKGSREKRASLYIQTLFYWTHMEDTFKPLVTTRGSVTVCFKLRYPLGFRIQNNEGWHTNKRWREDKQFHFSGVIMGTLFVCFVLPSLLFLGL